MDKVNENVSKDKEEKMSIKKKRVLIVAGLALVIILGIIFSNIKKTLDSELIYKGVRIDDIYVGEMKKTEALDKVKEIKEKDLDGKEMKLSYDELGLNYKISPRDLGFKYNYDKAIKEAYMLGRTGGIIDKLKEINNIKKDGKNIELVSEYDKAKANEHIGPIKNDINKEMINARFYFNGGKPSVTDESIGRKVDEEKLIKSINSNIYDLKPIKIPVEIINPTKTKAQLSRINGVIGEYSTNFKTSTKDRKENIRISANALTKGVVMPGEVFSFNNATGPRSISNGYKESTVIVAGEYTNGIGGGVCQTSTTLYNALLNSKLTVTERAPHSIPAKYVPLGKDAAVSYGSLDLKFRNDYDFPVYINSVYTGDTIKIQIYGDVNSVRK